MELLSRFTFGVGDRFAHQAAAQLRAFRELERLGCLVIPVWNKSNREHTFIGSEPASVRDSAEKAVRALSWEHPWHVDADHIRLDTVEKFLASSDFFTIDVADSIGVAAGSDAIDAFLARHPEFQTPISLPGLDAPIPCGLDRARSTAEKYLAAIQEAGKIYRRIAEQKGPGGFIAEVSMDETDSPQTPEQLLVILAGLADEGVLLQTVAPKFTGRFNKGVDYVGSLEQFEREFRQDIAVLRYAVAHYGLPENLKLSVHSGSDKFSLYPIIRRAVMDTGSGLHIKTAGTTWLEELIGLSESGGAGLAFVQEMYESALLQWDALCQPYASVIDIDRNRLPSPEETKHWSGRQWSDALRHVPSHPSFNPHVRQLLHVAFKLAAKTGSRFTDLLEQNAACIERNVYENLVERHMKPLFLGNP